MKVLIDTNVILDVLMKREPHYYHSGELLRLCGIKITGCMTASQTTDIFYLLRRYGKDTRSAKSIIKKLCDNIEMIDVNGADVQNALAADMDDYEDALLAYCARRHETDYVITRNVNDFISSPVPAFSPEKFVEMSVS